MEFLEITDFIELQSNLEHTNYNVGSSKIMDFCLKVCSEIETTFQKIIEHDNFNDIENIDEIRKKPSMNKYRQVIEMKYPISKIELRLSLIDVTIRPYHEFDENRNPEWFRIYSKLKHNKEKLIDEWNLRHCLYALGGLLINVIVILGIDENMVRQNILLNLSQGIFSLNFKDAVQFGFGFIDYLGIK